MKSDSLRLLTQQPEEVISSLPTDTFSVYKNEVVVVADFRTVPTDSIDSVWVQLAKDQDTFGWIRRSELLPKVVPDDPISQFISVCSDGVMHAFFIMMLFLVFYLCYQAVRKKWIDPLYPTLLSGTLSCSFLFWALIKHYALREWVDFYYHPTINPFAVTGLLKCLLFSVWSLIITAMATLDVIVHSATTKKE